VRFEGIYDKAPRKIFGVKKRLNFLLKVIKAGHLTVYFGILKQISKKIIFG